MRLNLGGLVAECGLECAHEAKDGVPADASSSALDLGDVGGVDGEACGELLLIGLEDYVAWMYVYSKVIVTVDR